MIEHNRCRRTGQYFYLYPELFKADENGSPVVQVEQPGEDLHEAAEEMVELGPDGRPRYAYFPFGGGPRQCIGNEFAMMECQLVVAMVVQRYRLHLVPGHPVEPDALAATLRTRHGILMTLQHA